MMKMGVPYKSLQNVRALPAKPGSILSWNSNVLHWGGRSSPWMDKPRISMGTYLMRSEGATLTGVKTDSSQPVTFDFRLGAIGTVLDRYHKDTITDEHFSPALVRYFEKYKKCAPGEWRFPQPAGSGDKEKIL